MNIFNIANKYIAAGINLPNHKRFYFCCIGVVFSFNERTQPTSHLHFSLPIQVRSISSNSLVQLASCHKLTCILCSPGAEEILSIYRDSIKTVQVFLRVIKLEIEDQFHTVADNGDHMHTLYMKSIKPGTSQMCPPLRLDYL